MESIYGVHITSKLNPNYRQWLKLLYARGRKQEKLFLIEGLRELNRALQANVYARAFIFQQSTLASQSEKIQKHFSHYLRRENCFVLADNLFKKLSVRENSDGIIGIADVWESSLDSFQICDDGLYLLVEHLEKPGNLGAMMRSAEATAIDGLLIADPCVDIFNPNVIRASQGAVFGLNIVWNTAERIYDFLDGKNIKIFAMTPYADLPYWDMDMTQTCVVCIGNEAHGLTPLWLEKAIKVTVPMFGKSADSLNAGIVGSLCLYEARRQRRCKS
jgi:TrmH family RNA methyltransferase